jgi:putative MATE family efflux protein
LNRFALDGSLLLAILRQGLPLAFGMASHALFNLVDLVLVGRLGADAVAGVHVATTINFLAMILGNGLSVATQSTLARMLGAGQIDRAAELSARSQIYAVLLGLGIGVVGAVFTVPCVDLQGVQGDARQVGIHYLLVTNLGTVTMFMLMQTTATMRALGETVMPFSLLIGGNLLNLGLDVVLLFGWEDLAIPAFGAPGAAYATVISRGVAAAIGLWWMSIPGYGLRLRRVRLAGPPGEFRGLVWIGLPQSLQMLVRAMAVIALTRIAGDLAGQSAIAALGVTTRLDTFVLFSAVGFASAATTVVGRNFGAGLQERMRSACRWAGLLALCFGLILVAVFAVFARPLVSLFVSGASEPVLAAGAEYLSVAALGHPFACFSLAVTGGVNGGGRVFVPMVLDAVGYLLVLIPAAILVASVIEESNLLAIWWIFAGVNLLLACAYAVYLQRGAWTHPRAASFSATVTADP